MMAEAREELIRANADYNELSRPENIKAMLDEIQRLKRIVNLAFLELHSNSPVHIERQKRAEEVLLLAHAAGENRETMRRHLGLTSPSLNDGGGDG